MSETTSSYFISPRSGHFGAESSFCQYYYPCMQDTGDMEDFQGGVSAVKFDAAFTDGEAWANPGYATTGYSITDYFTRPANSGHDFTLEGNALIIILTINKPTPGANEIILGGYTAGSAPGGLQITANSTGSVALAVNTTDNTSLSLVIANTYTPLDGTDRTLMWALPPDPVSAKFWRDGEPASSASAATVAGKSCRGGNVLNFGASRAGSAKVCKFARIQQYQVPCATLASLNLDDVATFAMRFPGKAVPNWMWGG